MKEAFKKILLELYFLIKGVPTLYNFLAPLARLFFPDRAVNFFKNRIKKEPIGVVDYLLTADEEVTFKQIKAFCKDENIT